MELNDFYFFISIVLFCFCITFTLIILKKIDISSIIKLLIHKYIKFYSFIAINKLMLNWVLTVL